jgi:transcriptional regulator of acetoin/glycerol metabolism
MTPPDSLQTMITEDPDLVDRIFDYLLETMPQLAGNIVSVDAAKEAVRAEFGGMRGVHIRRSTGTRSERSAETARAVLRLFNGSNATEVARRLHISRATVYRAIKQPGGR